MRNDQIDLSRIGGNPSALRTNYVVAYSYLGAGEKLASLLSNQGREKTFDYTAYWPRGWILLPQTIQDIMTTCANLQGLPRSIPHWYDHAHGDYASALSIPEFSGKATIVVLAFLVERSMLCRMTRLSNAFLTRTDSLLSHIEEKTLARSLADDS